MIDLARGIDSLTNFKRQTADYLKPCAGAANQSC